MYASDYRQIARERLSGNWGVSVAAAFLAALLGGDLGGSGGSQASQQASRQASQQASYIRPEVAVLLMNLVAILGIVILAAFILGGAVRLGYCRFLLNQHDGQEHRVDDLFSQFHRFGDGFVLNFLTGLYTALWSLLFVIPGIIAAYRYAMAPFILAEHPDMSASDAIRESCALMDGHKWELFCLGFSFIGWILLSVFTLGIGYLWLNPYMNASYAAFYREISK